MFPGEASHPRGGVITLTILSAVGAVPVAMSRRGSADQTWRRRMTATLSPCGRLGAIGFYSQGAEPHASTSLNQPIYRVVEPLQAQTVWKGGGGGANPGICGGEGWGVACRADCTVAPRRSI